MLYAPVPTIDYIPAIPNWIQTFPFHDFDIENFQQHINIIEFDHNAWPGANMIDLSGRDAPERSADILLNVTHFVGENFVIYIRRLSNMDFQRKMTANFMQRFNDWVFFQTINGLTPKFGNHRQHEERIFSSSGMQWAPVDGQPGVVDYMWQMRVEFQVRYERLPV